MDDDLFAVLTREHARFEERLKALLEIVEAVRRTEASRADLDAIARALDFFATEGARHEEIEEGTLFPRLRPLRQFKQVLSALEFQHGMNRSEGAQLRACVDRFVPARGVELQRLARRFVEMHRAHAMSEERALFPLAASALAPEAILEMSREARARMSRAAPAPEAQS